MNFDKIVNRENSRSIKYDWIPKSSYKGQVIPMWVADMDFKAPKEVLDSIAGLISHGVFGYSDIDQEYIDAVVNWHERRYNYLIKGDWLLSSPSVMFTINRTIEEFTNKGDSILICPPVYHLFAKAIKNNQRKLIESKLLLKDKRYEIDFLDFEEKIKDNDVKIFLLCSPHNPVSRLWTEYELKEIIRICKKYDVLIISDEIHADFVYKGYKHHNIGTLKGDYDKIILCTSPAKTFNLAGLQASNIIIENEEIRKKLSKSLGQTGFHALNNMGISATIAAYKHGEAWLESLLDYLENNISLLKEGLKGTNIRIVEPEATYLMWLDCRKLNLSREDLDSFFLNELGLYLNSGYHFGDIGQGFMRMNIGCPRATIEEVLSRLNVYL